MLSATSQQVTASGGPRSGVRQGKGGAARGRRRLPARQCGAAFSPPPAPAPRPLTLPQSRGTTAASSAARRDAHVLQSGTRFLCSRMSAIQHRPRSVPESLKYARATRPSPAMQHPVLHLSRAPVPRARHHLRRIARHVPSPTDRGARESPCYADQANSKLAGRILAIL